MADPLKCISVDAAKQALILRRKLEDYLLFKLRRPVVTITADVCCDPIVIDDPATANLLIDQLAQDVRDELNALGFCADDIV